MIHLSVSASRHCHYLFWEPWAAFPGTLKIGPLPGCAVTIGGVILALSDDTAGPPVSLSEEITFGWIHQGSDRWGLLGDHSVSHMGASGDIVVSDRGLPYTSTPTGKKYSFSGREVLSELLVMWGTPSTEMGFKPMTDYTSTGGLPVHWAGDYEYKTRVRFDGDFCVIEMITWTPQYTFNGTTFPRRQSSACRFFHRKYVGNQYSVGASPIYQSNLGQPYSGLNPTVMPDAVLPICTQYGVPMSVFSGYGYPMYRAEHDSDAEMASIWFNQIKSTLTGGWFVHQFQQLLADNPDPMDFGELGEDILSQMKYVDVNLMLTFAELTQLPEQLLDWKNLAKRLAKYPKQVATQIHISRRDKTFLKDFPELGKKLKDGVKLSSNAFLGQRYGTLPTVSDFKALIAGFQKLYREVVTHEKPQRLHSRRTTSVDVPGSVPIVTTNTLTVDVANFPRDFMGNITSAISTAKRWGVWPSCEALWDVVIYGFVADWFFDFGGSLHVVDEYLDREYYPIWEAMSSTKRSWSPPLAALWPDIPATGSITFKYYDRFISQELPLPLVHVGKKTPPNVKAHWLEASALVVQRIK